MIYTIYTLVTLRYSWDEVLKNVTSANAYTVLQGFTRKNNKLIGTNDMTYHLPMHIVNSSKASNQRDT